MQEYPTPCFLAVFFCVGFFVFVFLNLCIIHKCTSLAEHNQIQYCALNTYYVFMLQKLFS